MERIAEIRERLENLPATPFKQSGGTFAPANGGGTVAYVPDVDSGGVMEFIAIRRFVKHAPSDLRALLDVAEAAESAVENFFGYGRIQTETLFVKMKRLRETLDALDADTEETP